MNINENRFSSTSIQTFCSILLLSSVSLAAVCNQMEGLKAKLATMREELEAAQNREQEAKKKSKMVRERISSAEDEKRAISRRIEHIQKELEKVEDMTDDKLDRLERLNQNISETERLRRRLERKEMKEDGTLSHLESRKKSGKIFAEEAEQRYRESLNKLMLAERETAKVDERIRTAKNNEAYFTSKLGDAGSSVHKLTMSGESKQAKCDEYQERIRWLTDRKEKMVMAAESMERKVMQLEKKLIPLRQETRQMTRRGNEIKGELRDLLDEMNTYPS